MSRRHDIVGDIECLVGVLLDQDHGHPIAGGGARDIEQAIHQSRRQSERQLIAQQDPRLVAQRQGEREHLLLAAREQPGSPLAMVF